MPAYCHELPGQRHQRRPRHAAWLYWESDCYPEPQLSSAVRNEAAHEIVGVLIQVDGHVVCGVWLPLLLEKQTLIYLGKQVSGKLPG